MEDISNNLDQAINRGVQYLYHHQFPNGEFCAYVANDAPMQLWTATDSTVFPTALISAALLSLEELPKVDEILKKATFFFECQMHKGGVWNHFTNRHSLRALCPFDVDDTACVSAVFRDRGINWPLPSNVPLLLANRSSNGLFYTWYVLRFRWIQNRTYWRICLKEALHPVKSFFFWRTGEARRADIDAVVNANVLYYLGESQHTKPIIQYLIRIIEEHREDNCDTWYRNPYAVYYFMSRNHYVGCHGLDPIKAPIIERILQSAKPDGSLGENLLDTALAACTLLNFRHHSPMLKQAIQHLISKQRDTGEWERWILYWGGPKLLLGWGSEELTSAFCLEALSRYQKIEYLYRESMK